ncbi:putative nuclease of restriction endonuclease-like (RecB) superfamily [Curtobacterium sp. PhB130]|uniref:PDDEXK nuclease domain-containing protein n=1 Tax=unclassified Curtobacterium TaxID=257496 RepID=UPI000F4C7188|nr:MULTISPECIES: PDDEXK nuclease domain-containing protein [unclassified Curtobacterium]ROS78382.1 putative nuclease of restriction endonuclease-like (RecB) superfamily [Curtobacterium sp. PhB130]TCK65300.1 putative nuclease of restriction endonuclease-like (RecB) superfamily [Curtobacterium sp. PhB136]
MGDPVPRDYVQTLDLLKEQVRSARFTAQRRVNTELVRLYWRIGAIILDRQRRSGWGSGVVARLAADLRTAFPSMKGFSPRNLAYMRAFARALQDPEDLQQPVARLPWGHITVLLSRFDDRSRRDWYAERAVHHGWSRSVLEHHIRTNAHERFEGAPTNFERALAPGASDLAKQITKDPYVLDFLALDGDSGERALEQRLVDRISGTLRELGNGFAFVGRQVHFDVGGDDFFVDLLFFHVDQLRYVVIELKTGKFRPEQLGQLSFYVAVVDDRLRRSTHAETVGLLLVAGKSESTVRYSLGAHQSPVGVATYDLLPEDVRGALPSEHELEGLLAASVGD